MERKKTHLRKVEIIEAVKTILKEDGVQAITIKNIAQKINMSEGSIYRHFLNKHGILMALVEDYENSLLDAIENPIKRYKNPLDRLKGVMKAHMVFTEEKKGTLFAVTAESINFNDDKLRRRILEATEKYKMKIKSIINEAKQEGLIRSNINTEAVSLIFFGLVQASIVQFALTNYREAPVTKFDTFWETLLTGIET
ncbi:MAG: TetR/AcrR family transcriptional regulator C-terminal domain-containing protein [Candidatus Aceula meridiana]|nr:TetR/AcrR family transcriptional regulator C-terminal domain-containing protein [Candidatus Aceula meridiana]